MPAPRSPDLLRDVDPSSRRSGRLAHELFEALRGRLEGGSIATGDKLPSEGEIAESFGVGRGVVREALSRLQAAGLVQTHHGIGTFAVMPEFGRDNAAGLFRVGTTGDMLEMLELRCSVEAEAAGLAAARRTDAHLHEMRAALDDFARHLSAVGETVAPDFRFHAAIAAATANRYYVRVMALLGSSVIPRTRVASSWLEEERRVRHLRKVGREHEEIYAAIARRDSQAATAAMRLHLINSRERQIAAHGAGPENAAGTAAADRRRPDAAPTSSAPIATAPP